MNVSFLSCFSKGSSIVDAHMGGHFAHALKYAGYDAVILEGQSDKPVYLKIEDEKVSLEDASHVWGKGTFEVNATSPRRTARSSTSYPSVPRAKISCP